MLDGVLGEERLGLALDTGLQRRPDEVVEEERAVYEQGKAKDLQPFERLPAETKRDDPDEERAASIDGRAGSGTDCPCDGQAEEVESPVAVSMDLCIQDRKTTYPMLSMMRKLLTPMAAECVIW